MYRGTGSKVLDLYVLETVTTVIVVIVVPWVASNARGEGITVPAGYHGCSVAWVGGTRDDKSYNSCFAVDGGVSILYGSSPLPVSSIVFITALCIASNGHGDRRSGLHLCEFWQGAIYSFYTPCSCEVQVRHPTNYHGGS